MTWQGKHIRRSRSRQPLLVLATAAVLGFGAWSGTALRPEPADVAAPVTPVPTLPSHSPTPATLTPPAGTSTPSPSSATPEPEPTSAPPPPPPAGTGVEAYEAEVVAIVNAERAAGGCSVLTVDSRLAAAARAHSTDMATRDYFSHTTPEGITFDQRITNAGYLWSNAAENIAYGQRGPAAVMAAWMGSDGHRANILNCRLQQIGVGLAYDARGRPYWTQDFGTPR